MAPTTPPPRSSGPPRRLTNDQILDAALEILSEDGVAGLSQRRLGARLGVSHMALYRYFESKDALLDATAAHALPDPATVARIPSAWHGQLRTLLMEIHDAFVNQPGVAEIMGVRSGTGPRVDALRERFLSLMITGGLSPTEALAGLGVIIRFLAGCAIVESGARRASDADEAARLSALPAADFPVLTSIADQYPEHDSAGIAAIGVDMIIDSLRRTAAVASDF